MTENKNNKSGNGIGVGAALGVVFGLVYGISKGNISLSIAMGLAIGVAVGAIFDIAKNKKIIKTKAVREFFQCKFLSNRKIEIKG